MQTSVIYPGTFDPITIGHIDLIERASRLFSRVVVAVAESINKSALFTHEERITLTKKALPAFKNVEIFGFNNLLIAFAKQQGISVILRGLRAVSDFEYEFQLASMNRHMAQELETIFLTPAEQYSFISAHLIREVARLGGDVSQFVPPVIVKALKEKMKNIL